MTNIYDEMNKFENAFRNTVEYATLKEAIETVRADEEAKQLFTNFRDVQVKLQQKQMNGENLTDEELLHVQKVAQLAQQNAKIIAMLEAEMAVSKIVEELNRNLFSPIQEMYEGL